MNDATYMRRAMELARKGAGYTSPNPLVGAVIVKDGTIIGEGYHGKYGGRHAEAEAIDAASRSVEGASMFCNLEPCCHTHPNKHQPPCTGRLIREKIARVVISNIDPNPRVDGRGVDLLREAGVKVEVGLLADEGAALNEGYFKYVTTGIPFVTVKIAQSLDGRIATRNGDSRWITDREARRRVHEMRSASDAVLVGIGTVKVDDPSLSVRQVPGRDPVRIIMDSRLSIPLGARVVSDEDARRTVIVTTKHAGREKMAALLDRGVEVWTATPDENGYPNLDETLKLLGRRKIVSLLVEGGGRIFTSFIRQRLFDKLVVFIGPLLIGSGVDALRELGTDNLEQSLRLQQVCMEQLGEQVLFVGYRESRTLHDGLRGAVSCLRASLKR
jgi:diaminohydroxyphosphoribosylaminopyrimidine deaminase/5-amino-6-(5-phosphoribosylamino)uracil reductase